jgi:hypothetical protein
MVGGASPTSLPKSPGHSRTSSFMHLRTYIRVHKFLVSANHVSSCMTIIGKGLLVSEAGHLFNIIY